MTADEPIVRQRSKWALNRWDWAVIAFIVAVFAAAGALFLMSDGVGRTLDGDSIAEGIASGVAEETGEAADATCPEDVPRLGGTTFTCVVTLADGTTADVEVEVLNDDGWLSYDLAGIDGD